MMYSRKRAKKKNQRVVVIFLGIAVAAVVLLCMPKKAERVAVELDEVTVSPSEADIIVAPTDEEPTYFFNDPDNYVYPFNTMSADWGSDIYAEGFRYYEIPTEFARAGGCFPEVVQVYLWSLCKERGIDYYIMVALIERESDYQWDAVGDGGNSFGYMQIAKKWHTERMLDEGVDDLLNPYGNIKVGLNFFQYLSGRHLLKNGSHYVLMAYNMGETGAKACWDKGIYSSDYSREILSRAEDIKQELEQENR